MAKAYKLTIFCFLGLLSSAWAQQGQLSLPRIDQMPNEPSPYLMRDWGQVAKQYDAFVYDANKNGQYLPFLKIINGGVNYPLIQKFSLPSYVGSPSGNEAINVLPSLVSASLMGIDKSNQLGKNWVSMAYDFFNKANGENIYLNNAGANSGSDWWYDVMPNIYFYQLYDLYPQLDAEASNQFLSIANTFSASIKAMGGSDAPWQKAYMNYRAWKFKSMQPNASGVPEPEAAGSMAWVLYNAYQKTGNKDYLKSCEYAMEFLNEWSSNPAYELQLPYGVYTAARMNAALNTGYDVNKMLNWCFDKGSLRGWGAIKGKWGGLDVSGLIGEANDAGNDYAFQMNGLQQAAMLVPMIRYDKRYAKTIGKWVLNLANANRLFYHGFLPNDRQDATAWSSVYDGDRVIGYEALREVWQGKSPFSTGDALKGGWAATNLALYGTSSIGYLGSIVEKTNVEKVLKLDLLKTDFYKGKAYPSYLLYNPLNKTVEVEVFVGNTNVDIYESLHEIFIAKNVAGNVALSIPTDEAISIVFCPVNGEITYEKNKMSIDGVVVDYDQHSKIYTYAPRIKSLTGEKNILQISKTMALYCTATDLDSPSLLYQWSSNKGSIIGSGKTVTFTAPASAGAVEIKCIAVDSEGNSDTSSFLLSVVTKINTAPMIVGIDKSKTYASINEKVSLKCLATDADGDNLIYDWKANGGLFENTGDEVTWSASNDGSYNITVTVTDSEGAQSSANTPFLVKTFGNDMHKAIAYYPFSGNALDVSGNALHGQAKGAILNTDKEGNAMAAYYFNGGAQHILVPNHPKLNFTNAISVCAWIKPSALPEKETFILSHGSWQNRWKISVTPDRHLRWTINTLQGIADLDAQSLMNNETFTHVCATYDQDIMALYINGTLESYKRHTGMMRTTALDFLMGQMIPGNASYNFKGTIDEVAIFENAINPIQANSIYNLGITATKNISNSDLLAGLEIHPNLVYNRCMVKIKEDGIAIEKIVLVDTNGKMQSIAFKQSDHEVEIELSLVPSGTYTVLVLSKNKIHSGRLIKI
jgi:hypothetical protein